MSEQARIETAIDTTIDNCEVLRARLAKYEDADGVPITTLAEQVREIVSINALADQWAEKNHRLAAELTALKSQPSGVVLPERDDASAYEAFYTEKAKTLPLPLGNTPLRYSGGQYINDFALFGWMVWEACLSEVARLNQPTSDGDERAAFEEIWNQRYGFKSPELHPSQHRDGESYRHEYSAYINTAWWGWQQARAALSANHSEQVLEGWQLVPVEPIDAMLEAGDKYIGTPATYKAMLSACPSPAITKDFSQFLSAVMDAAGLIRRGRQSKELSEYLGMKCMEYRGAAPSAGSQKEQK